MTREESGGVTRVNERERVVVRMLADVEPARAAYVAVEALVKRGGAFGGEVLGAAMDGRAGAETTRSDRATREAQVKALFTALATARAPARARAALHASHLYV